MMWAIFSKSEPQNIAIKNSFKENFMSHEVQRLQNLQTLAKTFNLSVSSVLRAVTCLPNQSDQKSLMIQKQNIIKLMGDVKINLELVSDLLTKNNHEYQISVQTRDQQKQNDHIFFKNILLHYDNKRKQLKEIIYTLQNNVQQKEIETTQMTFRSYLTSRETVNISTTLNCEINEKFKEKLDCRIKVQQRISKQIHQILGILGQSGANLFKNARPIFDATQEHQYSGVANLVDCIFQKDKQIGQILTQKLDECQKFSHLVSQYNAKLKEAILKSETRARINLLHQKIKGNMKNVKKSSCVEYLKDESNRLNLLFQQGIDFRRGKGYSSKSCAARILKEQIFVQDNDVIFFEKKIKKNFQIQEDVTVSFNQHLEYIISDKFIQEDDL